MKTFHSAASIGFALCLLWPALVLAQAAPLELARSQASARFRRGVELFQEEAYRAALVEFERAYEIAPDYRLLYNIAQTRLEVQDYLGAAQSYEDYLMQGDGDVPPERRTRVEEALKALRERVGRLRVRVNRDAVDVFIDDQKVGRAPIAHALLVNVGRRRVSARGDDGESDARVVDLAGGDTVEVQLRLAHPQVALAPSTRPELPHDRPLSSVKKAGIATWAGGGALLVGGLVTSLLTMRSSDQLEQLLRAPEVDRDAFQRTRQTTRTLALSSDVLLGVGGALVLTGTLLWLLDKSRTDRPIDQRARAVHTSVCVGSLVVHGTF